MSPPERPSLTTSPGRQGPDPLRPPSLQGGVRPRQPQDKVTPLSSPCIKRLGRYKYFLEQEPNRSRGKKGRFSRRRLAAFLYCRAPLACPPRARKGKRAPDGCGLAPRTSSQRPGRSQLQGRRWAWRALLLAGISYPDPRSVPGRGTPLTPQQKSSWQPPPGSWSDNRAGCSPRGCSI